MDTATPHSAATDATDTGSEPSTPGSPARASSSEERLHRCTDDRMLAGVAAGMADYFDIDPTLVRIGFVALTLLGGLAIPLYLAGWLLIPEEGASFSVGEELLARERAR
ncbi:MAG TPA: PspC domain-containing protein [Acidimicrobiales bacterium]|jgi:phage shock protein PspC (stress-responsive transcriptional regulator)|nr:PspC domain-containing protein [Acidimicrobiales bacterium]